MCCDQCSCYWIYSVPGCFYVTAMRIALNRANNTELYRASLRVIIQVVLQKSFWQVEFDDVYVCTSFILMRGGTIRVQRYSSVRSAHLKTVAFANSEGEHLAEYPRAVSINGWLMIFQCSLDLHWTLERLTFFSPKSCPSLALSLLLSLSPSLLTVCRDLNDLCMLF